MIGLNLLLIAGFCIAAVAVWFSISVSSFMISLNIGLVLCVVGVEIAKMYCPDTQYQWKENKKVVLINLALVLAAANISTLLFMKSLA